MSDFPEDWNEFICEARKSFEECKKELVWNTKQNLILKEREDYLKSVCGWIDNEQIRFAKDNLKG